MYFRQYLSIVRFDKIYFTNNPKLRVISDYTRFRYSIGTVKIVYDLYNIIAGKRKRSNTQRRRIAYITNTQRGRRNFIADFYRSIFVQTHPLNVIKPINKRKQCAFYYFFCFVIGLLGNDIIYSKLSVTIRYRRFEFIDNTRYVVPKSKFIGAEAPYGRGRALCNATIPLNLYVTPCTYKALFALEILFQKAFNFYRRTIVLDLFTKGFRQYIQAKRKSLTSIRQKPTNSA